MNSTLFERNTFYMVLFLICLLMVSCPCNVIHADEDKGSKLWKAVGEGDVKKVQELLSEGVDPDYPLQGMTPLQMAIGGCNVDKDNPSCNEELIGLLLCNGADPNHKYPKGELTTMLHYLCYPPYRHKIPIARLFLCMGADPNAKSRTGRTPISCTAGYFEKDYGLGMIRLLLEFGADPRIPNNKGVTAIDQAECSIAHIGVSPCDGKMDVPMNPQMAALMKASAGHSPSKPECPDLECEKKCKLIAEVKHPIIPAHSKYYNQLTVKLECPEDQEKAEHKVKLETHFRNGHLVENKGGSNPERNLELTLLPDQQKDVFYHWVGDTNQLKPQPEVITIRVPTMDLEKQVNFTVGVDYKIDKIKPMAGEDGLCPAKEEPFIVNVEDDFNADSDLAVLAKEFNIKPKFKLESQGDVEDPFKFSDISSGFLSPILQNIYKKLVTEGKLHDPNKIHDECGGAQGYSIRGGKGKAWLKCDSRTPGYPFIEFYMKGKHRFLARIDHETDSNPFNNEYDLEAQIDEYSYPALNIFFNAFVPWLENLVNPLSEKFIVSFVGCCQETIGGASSLSGSSGGWESIRIVAKGATSCLIGVVGSKEFIEQYGKLPLINAIWSTGTFMMSIGDAYSTPCTVQTRKAMAAPGPAPDMTVDRTKAFTVAQSVLESLDDTRLVFIENQGVSDLKAMSSKMGNLKEAPEQRPTDKEIKRNPRKYDILSSKYRIMRGKNMTMIPAQKGDKLRLKLKGKGQGGRLVIVTKDSIRYKDFPEEEWGWFVEIKPDGSAKLQGADRSGFKTYQ